MAGLNAWDVWIVLKDGVVCSSRQWSSQGRRVGEDLEKIEDLFEIFPLFLDCQLRVCTCKPTLSAWGSNSYIRNNKSLKGFRILSIDMLKSHMFKSIYLSSVRKQLLFVQNTRPFSSRYGTGDDTEDLDAAREWFIKFNEGTIPSSISKTSFSKSGGPGGQKTNK